VFGQGLLSKGRLCSHLPLAPPFLEGRGEIQREYSSLPKGKGGDIPCLSSLSLWKEE